MSLDDKFDKVMRRLREQNDAALVDLEQRLRSLETACLPHALPVLPISSDSSETQARIKHLDSLERRVERLEHDLYRRDARQP